jgi:CHAD domain-containing protein
MGAKDHSVRPERLVKQPFPDVVTIIGRELAQAVLSAAPSAQAGSDEGIHQQRVAVRRLRSFIRCCAPVLDGADIDEIANDLSWLGSALGARRDVDVLENHLRSAINSLAPDYRSELTAHIDGYLRKRNSAADVRLGDVFTSERYSLLGEKLVALELGAFVRTDAPVSVEKVAGELIHGSWRRLAKSVDHIHSESDISEWHQVRTKAKKLRYVVDVFAPIFGKDYERLGQRLAAVTDELGEQRDSYVCSLALSEIADGVRPGLAFEVGRAAAAQDVRVGAAVDEFPKLWKRVCAAGRRAGM